MNTEVCQLGSGTARAKEVRIALKAYGEPSTGISEAGRVCASTRCCSRIGCSLGSLHLVVARGGWSIG